MAKRAKADGLLTTDWPTSWLAERVSIEVDFADLREELQQIATGIEPIVIPSDEEWEFILYMESIKQKWPSDIPYWWLHDYPSSEAHRARVKALNKDIERSGIREVATGATPTEGCPAWVVLRATEKQVLSSAFIDPWAALNILLGRLLELRELGPSSKAHWKGVKSAASNSTVGQHVWYARWVLKYARDLEGDRVEANDGIESLCRDVVSKSRGLPQESNWDREWFKKMLKRSKGSGPEGKVPYAGYDKGLADRLTRMNAEKLKRLAGHKWITADLLPPLDVDAYPVTNRTSSSHP
jgi:hypothetical protein